MIFFGNGAIHHSAGLRFRSDVFLDSYGKEWGLRDGLSMSSQLRTTMYIIFCGDQYQITPLESGGIC
jgi:hypothetical protein